MEIFVVSDIGGTQLRVAAYAVESLKQLSQERVQTRDGIKDPIDRLIELVKKISAGHSIKAVAVGAPGFLDPAEGLIYEAPNIIGWINLPLVKILEDALKVPVYLGNDANLAALGEWKFGAGKGYKNLLYLTISTGIGSGAIINNQLLLGHRGLAAEFGHVTVQPEGPLCGCGHRGHLEAFSSGTAITNFVIEAIGNGRATSLREAQPLNARKISEAAKKGDALAFEAFERAGKYLGIGLANFLHMLNPHIVILGGGVSLSGDLLLKPLRKSLEDSVISPEYLKDLVITTAQLGDEVGLFGALALLLTIYSPQQPDPPE